MDKVVKERISSSVKPTITKERRQKMSNSMKGFWAGVKRDQRKLKKLEKENKQLREEVANQSNGRN